MKQHKAPKKRLPAKRTTKGKVPEPAELAREKDAKQQMAEVERVYFGVDVQKTAEEVGGWDNLDQLKMSVGVVFRPRSQKLRIFLEEDVPELVKVLREADCAVGFNVLKFDLVVLSGYGCKGMDSIRCVDMYHVIRERCGFGVSMDSLLRGTFGEDLGTAGLELVRLWREGRHQKVIESCCNQVLAVNRLHEFFKENRFLRYADRVTGKRGTLSWD